MILDARVMSKIKASSEVDSLLMKNKLYDIIEADYESIECEMVLSLNKISR